MVFNVEKKRVAQQIRKMPRDDYAMIDAQRMMDVNDAANFAATFARRQARQPISDGAPRHEHRQHTVRLRGERRLGRGSRGGQVQLDLSALHGRQRRDGAAASHPETGARAAAARRRHQERRGQGAQQHHSDDKGAGTTKTTL